MHDETTRYISQVKSFRGALVLPVQHLGDVSGQVARRDSVDAPFPSQM